MSNRPQSANILRPWRFAWLVAAGLSLIGCTEVGGPFSTRSGASQVDPTLVVDAEEFRLEDVALWEGGVTEAGAWIAHPDAQVARRVRITNAETGAQVDAALILRDAAFGGPGVIVSTTAAGALEMEPGRETPVVIEALRYPTPEEIAAARAAPAEATSPPDGEAVVAEAEGPEPGPAIEVSTLDGSAEDAEAPSETAPSEAAPSETAPSDTAPIDADAATHLPDGAAESADDASPEALSAAVEVALDSLDHDVSAAEDQSSASETALSPGPGAPIPRQRPANQTPVPASPEAQTAIADGRPYVQAGAFAVAADAELLAGRLRDAGMPVKIRPLTLGAEQLSRVLVGPYETVAERDAALRSVRESGLTDAAPARY